MADPSRCLRHRRPRRRGCVWCRYGRSYGAAPLLRLQLLVHLWAAEPGCRVAPAEVVGVRRAGLLVRAEVTPPGVGGSAPRRFLARPDGRVLELG